MTADATDVSIPALLRAARNSYGQAIRRHLEKAGIDDLPRSGPFVLGGMANHGGTAADLLRGLNVSKQAASQLVDTLVLRGFLLRDTDPDDRRRMTIALTERGGLAAEAVRNGIAEVDTALTTMVTPAELDGMRAGLYALATIKDSSESTSD